MNKDSQYRLHAQRPPSGARSCTVPGRRVRQDQGFPGVLHRLMRSVLFVILSFAIPHSAQSAIIYSGLQNIAIPTTFDGIYLDIDTGATSTSSTGGWDVNFFFGGIGIGGSAAFQPARRVTGNLDTSMDTIRLFDLYDHIDDTLAFSIGETGSSDHLGAPGNF
ncbi:hypothetical protein [Prosthecobacter sp.]